MSIEFLLCNVIFTSNVYQCLYIIIILDNLGLNKLYKLTGVGLLPLVLAVVALQMEVPIAK